MKKILFLILIMVCALTANAQTYLTHLQAQESGKGKVTVHQSHELDVLVNGKGLTESPEKTSPRQTTATKSVVTPKHEDPKKHEEMAKREETTKHEEVAKHDDPMKREEMSEREEKKENTYIDTSRKVMRGAYKVTGYRVQVYAGGNSRTDKTKAERIGNEIKNSFPGQPVYVHFYSPRWICRMGNFRSYEEAKAMLARVKAAGFKEASLVKGKITVTN